MKKILIGCEYSGIVRDAFIKEGFDAWSCDLLNSETKGNHYKCDILEIINKGWDLGIFHPPCTRLCNSGVRWLDERKLWKDMHLSALFFKKLLDAPIPHIAIENPIMHKYAIKIIEKRHTQTIQPYQFGHTTSKKTCLWLKNLPNLIPTKIIPEEQITYDIHLATPSSERWKERSKTFKGIAKAMAKQWGSYIINNNKYLNNNSNQLSLL